MDPQTIALIIILIGALLIIVEAFSPGAFMVIPGTVLVIIGIIGYAYPDFLMSWYSPVSALIISIPVTLITVKGYQLLAKPVPPSTTVSESLLGKTGTVTVDIEPGSLKGKVKIDSDIWSATSDEFIEKGAKVIVCSAEGVHVKLERILSKNC